MGTDVPLNLLSVLEIPPPNTHLLGCLVLLDIRAFALYLILLCLSLGGLSEGKWTGSGSRGKESWGKWREGV